MQVTFDIENYLNSIHEQPFKAKKLQRINTWSFLD